MNKILLVTAILLPACGPATVTDLDSPEALREPLVMPAPASSAASTAPAPVIYDALGARLTERANGFIEKQLNGRDLAIHKDRIEKPDVKCFDKVGINNLDVATHIDLADLDWQVTPDGLAMIAWIDYLSMTGQLFGEDSDFFDLCPSFTATIQELRLEGIIFTANVVPSAENYEIYVDFNQVPQLQVENLIVDINNIPDFVEDLVFSAEFVQDFLFRKVNEMLAEKVPELTKEALFYAMFTGTAGPGFDYAVGAASIDVDAEGANALFDVQVDFDGVAPPCLPPADMPAFVVRGTNGLGQYGDDSMLELSVADAAVNEVLWAAWKSGFLCFDSELHPLESFERVLEGINPVAGEMLKYRIVVAKPPQVLFEDGKVQANIEDFFLEAKAIGVDGTEKQLLLLRADLKTGVKLDVDRATNRLLVSLDGADLEFTEIESEVLFNEERDTEEHLKQFVKGFVIPRLNNRINDMPVTNALFPVSDYIILLDAIHLREGHAVAGASVFRSDDPEVDKIAPDTSIVSLEDLVERTYTTVEYGGSDDRGGTLVYSWQVDGAGWSSWSEELKAEVSALTQGVHSFEVKSRDRWMNEDPSPASASFTVAAQKEPAAGCGCDLDSSNAAPSGALASLLAAVMLGLTIRRRTA